MTEIRDNGHRYLMIRNYRNLGITQNEGELPAFFKLDRSLRRGDLGGIVLVIGPNNSGKSNILDALEAETLGPRNKDRPDFVFKDVTPELKIVHMMQGKVMTPKKSWIYSGASLDVLLCLLLEKERFDTWLDMVPESQNPDESISLKEYADIIFRLFHKARGSYEPGLNFHPNRGIHNSKFNALRACLEKDLDTDSEMVAVFRDCTSTGDFQRITAIGESRIRSSGTPMELSRFKGLIVDEILNRIQSIRESAVLSPEDGKANEHFRKELGYELYGHVVRYVPKKISSSDMECTPDKINRVFDAVFSACGFDKDAVSKAYADNRHGLGTLEKMIKESLNGINDRFNGLLRTGEDNRYRFEMRLEREMMILSLYRGNDISLDIDRQSAGFRWLLEFFIEIVLGKGIGMGDIVLIDEFGNSLNWSTVNELTQTLREIGRENGVKFVLATQNPMAVDIDHLDELRLVEPTEDGPAIIHNDFTQFSNGDHDVLRPILDGLTVGRNYMRTEGRSTIFVEGATDYFYLSGFRRLLDDEGESFDIDFIPLNGVGISRKDAAGRVAEIKAVERRPIFLVDGDNPGKAFKKVGEEKGVVIFSLSEAFDGNKEEIEDLFENGDLERFNLEKSDEGSEGYLFDRAAVFSQGIIDLRGEISDGTKENFRRLFRYIEADLF